MKTLTQLIEDLIDAKIAEYSLGPSGGREEAVLEAHAALQRAEWALKPPQDRYSKALEVAESGGKVHRGID